MVFKGWEWYHYASATHMGLFVDTSLCLLVTALFSTDI